MKCLDRESVACHIFEDLFRIAGKSEKMSGLFLGQTLLSICGRLLADAVVSVDQGILRDPPYFVNRLCRIFSIQNVI